MASQKLTRDQKIIFRLINEQNALIQALLSVLSEHGLIEMPELRERFEQAKHDSSRAAKVYRNLLALLREIPPEQ